VGGGPDGPNTCTDKDAVLGETEDGLQEEKDDDDGAEDLVGVVPELLFA
jgi:hypothetical protein